MLGHLAVCTGVFGVATAFHYGTTAADGMEWPTKLWWLLPTVFTFLFGIGDVVRGFWRIVAPGRVARARATTLQSELDELIDREAVLKAQIDGRLPLEDAFQDQKAALVKEARAKADSLKASFVARKAIIVNEARTQADERPPSA